MGKTGFSAKLKLAGFMQFADSKRYDVTVDQGMVLPGFQWVDSSQPGRRDEPCSTSDTYHRSPLGLTGRKTCRCGGYLQRWCRSEKAGGERRNL